MNWRDRISILSKKKSRKTALPQVQIRSTIPSPSGSGGVLPHVVSEKKQTPVDGPLSPIRSVIGPDHKSYYILLRGNEDSFTYIQPAMDVADNLGDIAKNLRSSVELANLSNESESPTPAKKPQLIQAETNKQKQNEAAKTNGVEDPHIQTIDEDQFDSSVSHEKSLLGRGIPEVSSTGQSVNIPRPFPRFRRVTKIRQSSTGTCHVMEYEVNSDQKSKVIKTSTLAYPLVQNNKSTQNSAVQIENKNVPSFYVLSDSVGVQESEELPLRGDTDLIENIIQNRPENSLEPSTFATLDIRLASKNAKQSLMEVSLVATEGTGLLGQDITAQIMEFIESEHRNVRDGKEIVRIRFRQNNAEPIRQWAINMRQDKWFSDHVQMTTRIASNYGGSYCAMLGCKNQRARMPEKNFFRFPIQDKERCIRWVTFSGRPDLLRESKGYLNRYCHLCEDHFTNDKFTDGTKQRLVKDAIPTLKCKPSEESNSTTVMNDHLYCDFTQLSSLVKTQNQKAMVDKMEKGITVKEEEDVTVNKEEDNTIKEEEDITIEEEEDVTVNEEKDYTIKEEDTTIEEEENNTIVEEPIWICDGLVVGDCNRY